jgi:hypothetical protein
VCQKDGHRMNTCVSEGRAVDEHLVSEGRAQDKHMCAGRTGRVRTLVYQKEGTGTLYTGVTQDYA